MSFTRGLLAVTLGLAAGCASATAPENQGQPDANTGPGIDAPEQTGIDAPVAPVDAPPGPCTTMTRQLLANENFDATPAGTGWMPTPLNAAYPIVTQDDGVAEHSPALKAWLGGVLSTSTTTKITDVLVQSVQVPAGTTALVFTGQHWIASSDSTAVAYDTVDLTIEAGGSVVGMVLHSDNRTRHTAWQPLSHTVANAAALAGQTVQLKITSSHDDTFGTNFFFDSFALTATYCQ